MVCSSEKCYCWLIPFPPLSLINGKLEKLRFYFSGDNIAEITGLSDGFDPEKGYTASNTRTSLPFSRSWTIGVDLTF